MSSTAERRLLSRRGLLQSVGAAAVGAVGLAAAEVLTHPQTTFADNGQPVIAGAGTTAQQQTSLEIIGNGTVGVTIHTPWGFGVYDNDTALIEGSAALLANTFGLFDWAIEGYGYMGGGIYGYGGQGIAVKAVGAGANYGVHASSDTGNAVYGTSGSVQAVMGEITNPSNNQAAVLGVTTGPGTGVWGDLRVGGGLAGVVGRTLVDGTGVWGQAWTGTGGGVFGQVVPSDSSASGVHLATNGTGDGVFGESKQGIGVAGITEAKGAGVWGTLARGAPGYAGSNRNKFFGGPRRLGSGLRRQSSTLWELLDPTEFVRIAVCARPHREQAICNSASYIHSCCATPAVLA